MPWSRAERIAMRLLKNSLAIMLLLTGCSFRSAPCNDASFATFWASFQSATVTGDVDEVQQYVRFPLFTRGPSDGDPFVPHQAEFFALLWSRLLEQDPGLRMEPETTRAFIARHAEAPAGAVDAGGENARVADLVFSCRAGTWQLTMAYTSE